jgi:hypothetical protein
MSDESEFSRQANSARRRLQIHLSTAIGMMFIAAVLLSLNLIPSRQSFDDGRVRVLDYGFPIGAYGTATFTNGYVEGGWSWPYVAVDVAFAIGMICLAAVSMEYFIRKKLRS